MAKTGKFSPKPDQAASAKKQKQPAPHKEQPPIPEEPAKKPSLLKRIWEITKTILSYTIMLAAVAMLIFTLVSMNTFDRDDRNIMGYKALIVRSDSMSATDFDAGDLVIIKEVDPTTLMPGDIISFHSEDPDTPGETFTHKIREITQKEDGTPAFITYGTTTGVDDLYPVSFANVLGKYQFSIPKVGTFFAFMKTTPGYIVCIFLPFLIILFIQGGGVINEYRQAYKEREAEAEAAHQKQLQELEEQKKKEQAIQQKQIRYLMLEVKALKETVAKLTEPPEEPQQ